jgi:hypothetical protein
MAYCSASDVAGLCQNILNGKPTFGAATCPMTMMVKTWMSSGCGIIETRLGAAGYATPVASTTSVYQQLVDCNALYAAARVEMSRTNITLGPGERTRGQVFQEMFEDCITGLLEAGDLTMIGLSRNTARGTVFAGGISASQKQSQEADTDRVRPRFERGQMNWEGSTEPRGSTASGR